MLRKVIDHDFSIKEFGKATPYGIYERFRNYGFVNISISEETAEFAVESIRQWWLKVGNIQPLGVKKIYITADSGGSNGFRVCLWKVKL